MLVLSRRPDERIRIGEDIFVTVVAVRGDAVRLGFEAPVEVVIDREEVWVRKQQNSEVGGQRSDKPAA